jgi:hypothetical protein
LLPTLYAYVLIADTRQHVAARCGILFNARSYTQTINAWVGCTWGPFLNSPLGVNLALSGVICPLGGMFIPSFTPRGEHSLLFRRMEGQTENFTPEGQIRPWGKSLPLGAKLTMGLSTPSSTWHHYLKNICFLSLLFFLLRQSIHLRHPRLLTDSLKVCGGPVKVLLIEVGRA